MRCWIPLLFCAVVVPLGANPLIPMHPAYISSERLEVVVDDTSAQFSGVFHFASPPGIAKSLDNDDVYFNVPIWIPENPAEGDQSIRDFYAAFGAGTKLSAKNRPVFERAFRFQMHINGRPHPINGFSLAAGRNRKSAERSWNRPGFNHILVYTTFRPESFKNNPEFRLSYRQPLRLRGTASELLYVPNFENLPENRSTESLDVYALILSNPQHRSMSVDPYRIPSRSKMTLPLRHHVPIHVVCREK